jgi:hypothetical protein
MSNFLKTCIIAFVLIIASPAAAHYYETDGSISALMHIHPNDTPAAKEPTDIGFQIIDTAKKFKGYGCDCSVEIFQDGKQVFQTQLNILAADTRLQDKLFTVTFPEKAVYSIRLIGKPKTNQVFQPFTLDYSVRVDRDAGEETGITKEEIRHSVTHHGYHYFIACLLLMGIGIAYLWDFIEKRSRK